MSFARLVNRLKVGLATPQREEQPDRLRLATAAVLLEIGYADGKFDPAEGEDLTSYLQRAFHLGPDDARALIDAAAEIRSRTIDHFALTNFIRKNAPLNERIEIVKTMWRMVYADGKLTDYENYLVRKLADLLGLEHHVMIDAKVAVLRDLGLAAQ
ncbi:MAG TPA: TerB family tellurite resistance protein [Thermoanaerobaculia bacterium]|nr:TerB family tellurite resistance protein [Thermoanaerobaculia bacterium]